MLSLSLGEATSDEVLRHDPQPADKFQSRSVYRFSFPKEQWQHVQPGAHTARLAILVAYQHPHYVNSTSDWIVRIDKPVTVRPKSTRKLQYTPGLDEAVARSLRAVARPESTVADGLRWDGKRIVLSIHCDGAPTDIYAQVSVGIGTGGYLFGFAHWRKGESGMREFSAQFKEVKAAIGNTVNVTLIGTPDNAESTLEKGDWWVGTVKFDGVTVADATKPFPPESLTVPEVQIHRPGTKLRRFGYYPVTTTQTTTRPAK